MPVDPQNDKIPYLLKEHGRFYYQRKVPLDVQDAVGFKKWREALGAVHLDAVRRLVELKEEHDKLLKRLADTTARQEYKTQQRRGREVADAASEAADDVAFRNWVLRHGAVSVADASGDEQAIADRAEIEANLGRDPISLARLIPLRPAAQDVVIGGCGARDVLQMFSYARPLEIRSPDVAPGFRGAFSR